MSMTPKMKTETYLLVLKDQMKIFCSPKVSILYAVTIWSIRLPPSKFSCPCYIIICSCEGQPLQGTPGSRCQEKEGHSEKETASSNQGKLQRKSSKIRSLRPMSKAYVY